MGRFRESQADDGADAGIDMSPLMDCVFILLIFFIVTTTFVEESGVQMEKSQPGTPNKLNKVSVVIVLTGKGEVLHEDKPIGISGIQPLVRSMIRDEETPVIIQADGDAPTGLLVRLVDEARLAGAVKVNVATRKTRS